MLGDADPISAPNVLSEQRTFRLACDLGQSFAYSFLKGLVRSLGEGRLLQSLQSLVSLGPVGLAIAPYIAAFKTQHKDEALLASVLERFPQACRKLERRVKKAWVTDTFDDTNGVTNTIRSVASLACKRGKLLKVITCRPGTPKADFEVKNFAPLGTFDLPEYPELQVHAPPFLEVLHHLEEGEYTEVTISTPGPMGLTALIAAKLLRLKTVGIYHTNFPEYVRQLTDDANLEALTRRYMHFFYGAMDAVQVPSETVRRSLIEDGFSPDTLHVVGRGVDLERFSPARRDSRIWRRHGIESAFKFLYVGRISREKNVELLLQAFEFVRRAGHEAACVVVGEGPMLAELKRRHARHDVRFLGELRGEALAEVYASADAFVFPSLTDTYGNVVLEAHASGLPAIVMGCGGPQETVRRFQSGIVVEEESADALARAMERIVSEPVLAATLRERAIAAASFLSWDQVLDTMWNSNDTAGEVPQACTAQVA
jgi:glycosyltransferase involved in cell wall biosynthesis